MALMSLHATSFSRSNVTLLAVLALSYWEKKLDLSAIALYLVYSLLHNHGTTPHHGKAGQCDSNTDLRSELCDIMHLS